MSLQFVVGTFLKEAQFFASPMTRMTVHGKSYAGVLTFRRMPK
jgi:hypothetical protein